MTANFMIKADIDLSAVEQKLRAFQQELNTLRTTNSNAGQKVPVLPGGALERIGSPVLPSGVKSADPATQAAAIKKATQAQAQLVALKLQELSINQKLLVPGSTGLDLKTVAGKAELEKGFLAAKAGLESQLGRELTAGVNSEAARLRAAITRLFNELTVKIEMADDGVVPTPVEQGKRLQTLAAPVLASQNLGPVKLVDVATPAKQALADQKKADAANKAASQSQIQAAEAELAASRIRIEAAREQAAIAAEAAAAAGRARTATGGPYAAQLAAQNQYAATSPTLIPSNTLTPSLSLIIKALDAYAFAITGESAAFTAVAQAERQAYEAAMGGLVNQIVLKTTALANQQIIGTANTVAADKALRGQAAQFLNNDPELAAQAAQGDAELTAGLATQRRRALERIVATNALEDEYAAALAGIVVAKQKLHTLSERQYILESDYITDLATSATLREQRNALLRQELITTPAYITAATEAQASLDALSAKLQAAVASSPSAVAARAERTVVGTETRAAVAGATTGSPVLKDRAAAAEVSLTQSLTELSVAVKRLALATDSSRAATVEEAIASEQLKAKIQEELAANSEYIAAKRRGAVAQNLINAQSTLPIDSKIATLEAQAATLKNAGPAQTAALAAVEAELVGLRNLQKAAVNQEIAGSAVLVESEVTAATAQSQKAAAVTAGRVADQANLEATALATLSEQELAVALQRIVISMPALLESTAQLVVAAKEQRAALEGQLLLTKGNTEADLELLKAKQRSKIALNERFLADEAAVAAEAQLVAQRRAIRGASQGSGLVAGIRAAEGGDAGMFFGRGLATTIKYALPSALLFGAFAGMKGALQDSEDLAITLTKIESQLQDIDHMDVFEDMKDQIFEVSSETGIMAAEIGDVLLQLQGAFGDISFDADKVNQGGLLGSDDIIRYGDEAVQKQLDAAGKLSVVTGIASEELVDGLTAASFAFGTSADRIGDVATRLETSTGVKAKETISFLGDIGPVADQAGFSLEEFASIAALAQKRSGQTGTVLAEQFGRIIPAITKNRAAFFDIANQNPDLFDQDFIDAVQRSDTRAIFQELAKNFDQLNEGSKEFLIQLIGGRREANALLSVFGDTKSLKTNLDAANSAAGTLDKRFAALQKRLSTILKQIGVEFTALTKTLIDGGFGKAIGLTLIEIRGILKIVNALLSPFRILDELSHGMLSNFTALAIQIKLITALITALSAKEIGATGATMGSRLMGLGMVAPFMSGSGVRFFDKTRSAYRTSLINSRVNALGGPAALGGGGFTAGSNALLRAGLGVGAKAGAAGKGLLTLLGGPTGVGFLAAAGLFAGYEVISNKIESDTRDIGVLQARLADSKKSGEQLRKKATEIEEDESIFTTLWRDTFNIATEADVHFAESYIKDRKDRYKDLIEINKIAPERVRKAIKGQGFRIGMSRSKAIENLESVTRGEDKTVYFKDADTPGAEISPELAVSRDAVARIAKRIGIQGKGLNVKVAQALLEDDPIEALQALQKDKSRNSKIIVDQATQALTRIQSFTEKNAGTAELYADIRDPMKKLANAENDELQSTIEDLKNAVQGGRISFREYRKSLESRLKQLQGVQNKSTEEKRAIRQIRKDLTDETTRRILNQQEADLELAQLIDGNGAGSEAGVIQTTIQNNLNNLNNDDFNDPEERRKAALAVITQQKELYDHMLETSTDIEFTRKLLAEGFEIPAEARAALTQYNIENSGKYIELADDFQRFRTDDSPQMKALKASLGFKRNEGPGKILEGFLEEFFSAEGVSAETITDLTNKYQGLQAALDSGKLNEAEKETVRGTLKFIAELLGLTGDLPAESDGFLTAARKRAKVAGKIFGVTPTPGNATPGGDAEKEREAAERAAKLEDAQFALRQAQMNRNSLAIARLQREQAVAQLRRAEALKDDDPEKALKIIEAQTAIVKADQEIAKVQSTQRLSVINLNKARAEATGDTLAAAQLDVAAAQESLRDARQGGDPAEINAAAAQLITAQKAVDDARAQVRDAQVALLKALVAKDDPVIQARFDVHLAQLQLQEARGTIQRAEAALRLIEAENSVRDAMQAAHYSVFNLRQAQLQSIEDEVGAANVARQLAAQQLRDAIANGAGDAAINNARAALITADKAARDALFQDKLDDYKYLLDMGQITKSQYISYLEAVKQTLLPGTKQFKELELTLKQLKNDISSDLQANLPTSLALPTIYEVRRLNQSTAGPQNLGGGIGYQDNRRVDVQITIGQNMSSEEITAILGDALGLGRNGTRLSRY